MTPIDSRLLIRLLREMCCEINNRSIEFLLATNNSMIKRLTSGYENHSYWPTREQEWLKNAEKYKEESEKTFRDTGISKLIRFCPTADTKFTSLEERLMDLIYYVFKDFYDDDITEIKQQLSRRLFALDAPPKDIACIESLTDPLEIAEFLAYSAKKEGLREGEAKKKKNNKNPKRESNNTKSCLAYNIPLMIDGRRYIHRADKVRELLDLLKAGNRHIFVTGSLGVGKSCFMAEFCQSADNYELHYTVFKGSIKATIVALEFEGNRNTDLKEHDKYKANLEQLRALDKNTVLIIDQFEGIEDSLFDEYYRDLEALQISIVFVTRSRFERPTVFLEPFNERQLLGLFEFYCGHDFVTYYQEELLRLISAIEGNTLFADLLGRNFKKNRGGINLDQVLQDLKSGILKANIWDVAVDSDYQDRRKKPIPERLVNLFGILFDRSCLTEKELYILARVSCYGDEGTSAIELVKMLREESSDWINVIDDLITLGWLSEREVLPKYWALLDKEIVLEMSAQKHLKRIVVPSPARIIIAGKVHALCAEKTPNWDRIKLYAYACLPSMGSTAAIPNLFGLIWDAIDRSTITKCEYIRFTEELADALCCGCENDNIGIETRSAITSSYLHGFISLDHDYPFNKEAIRKIELLLNIWNKEEAASKLQLAQKTTESSPVQTAEHALRIWQAACPHQIPTLRINPWNRKNEIEQGFSEIVLLHLQRLALHYSSDPADVGKLINAHVALGLINQSEGVHKEAIFHFEQALALLSDNDQLEVRQVVAIYMNLAASQVELKDFYAALNVLDSAYRYITKYGDAYPCEQIFVYERIISLCWEKELYQEAPPYLSEIPKLPFSGIVDETHLLVDLTVATRNVAAGLESAATTNFLDVLDKEIISKVADAMVTYYRHYVSDMTENFVAQHFQQNNIPIDKQTLTKHVFLNSNRQNWLQNTAFYRTGKASPNTQYITWQLLQMEELFDLQKEYVSSFLSHFVAVYEEQFRTEIQRQLNVKGLSKYGFLIEPKKVIFGDKDFLNSDYDEYAIRKEVFRQNLFEMLNDKDK